MSALRICDNATVARPHCGVRMRTARQDAQTVLLSFLDTQILSQVLGNRDLSTSCHFHDLIHIFLRLRKSEICIRKRADQELYSAASLKKFSKMRLPSENLVGSI